MMCGVKWSRLKLVSLVAVVLLLPGCGPKKFNCVHEITADYQPSFSHTTDDDVTVKCWKVNGKQARNLFTGGRKFLAKVEHRLNGLYSIRVENNSDQAISFSRDDIGLAIVEPREACAVLARDLAKDKCSYGASLGIGSGVGLAVGIPVGIIGTGLALYLCMPILGAAYGLGALYALPVITTVGTGGGAGVGALVGGLAGSYSALDQGRIKDEQLAKLTSSLLDGKCVVEPGEVVDVLVVAEKPRSKFNITLHRGDDVDPMCVCIDTRRRYEEQPMMTA